MPTFIRLASLTDQGAKNIENFPEMLAEAKEILAQHGASVLQAWVVLGEYDIIAVIEAPDAKTAAHISGLIAARGNFRAKTLAAIPIPEFSAAIKTG